MRLVISGCEAGSIVGGLAVRFTWPRQDAQAPEEPDSALKPTKTFCVLVAATRAGPEFA